VRAFPGRPRHGVRPSFHDPRFAFLVAGVAVNSVGGWASAIALWGFVPYRFNAGPYAVALTIVCWAAPPALLSAPAGVLIDRLGPRRALVAAYIAAAIAALGMAATGSLTGLDIAAAGYGITRALAGPAANALPPRIVAADDLLPANALLGAAASVGQVTGPLAASAALALSGFPAAFVLDAATYLVGAAAVVGLPVTSLQEHPTVRPAGTTVALPRQRTVQLVVLLSVAVTFTSAAFLVVEPLYARHVLHRPPSQFALFEAAIGTGGILAGLLISRMRSRLAGARLTSVGAACYGLAACLFAGTAVVPAAYAGAFVWGVSGTLFGTVSLTTLQRAAPVAAHGRVMGLLASIQSWVETAGLPLGGVVLGALGVRAGAAALAGVPVVAGLVCWVAVRSGSGGAPQLT